MIRVGKNNEWMNERSKGYILKFHNDREQGVTYFNQTCFTYSCYFCKFHFEYGGYTERLFVEIRNS